MEQEEKPELKKNDDSSEGKETIERNSHEDSKTNEYKSNFNFHKKKHRNRKKSFQFQPRESQPQPSHEQNKLDAGEASDIVKEKLAKVLKKKAESTVSITQESGDWVAMVEIVDEEYLPGKNLSSMSDIIGTYEVRMSETGKLLGWTKKTSRSRGRISSG